jgi:serine/threonine-protein kinase
MSLVGKSIGRYRIMEQLGQGGMAVVYKAYDTRLERDVAMKVIRTGQIPPDHLNKLLKRFEREAKAQAKFDHPHIVPVYDYGEHEGSPYLVMAYRPGGTMKQMTGKPMSYQEAAQLLVPIASALAYAHKRNVLHRDVKPSNILISEDGIPAITDFGIAKLLETEEATLTGTGVGIGTPEYMAPEQWRGKSVHQTDIFALGVVFYELVTGRRPYEADTPAAIILLQAQEPLPRPSEMVPHLPEEVEKVLYKALALEPKDRYENMTALYEVLEKLSQMEKIEVEEDVPTVDEISRVPEPATPPMMEGFAGSEAETSDAFEDLITGEKEEKKRSRFWIVLGVVAIVLTVAAGIGFVFFRDEIVALLATNTPVAPIATTPADRPTPMLGVGSILVRDKDDMEMVYIPAGGFEMGSDERGYNESPMHTVYLDAYWIDKYEVTNEQFAAFLNEEKNQLDSGVFWLDAEENELNIQLSEGEWVADDWVKDHPVAEVSWYGAKAYCEWVGGRLPTEAEWEKAARGELENQRYPWGNEDPTCTLGAGDGAQYAACDGQSVEVGSFASNSYGVYDMAGNVLEWVADWYDWQYYESSPPENPGGPPSGDSRIVRGGSWSSSQIFLLVSYRAHYSPTFTDNYIGFRCVKTAESIDSGSQEAESAPPVLSSEEVESKTRDKDNMEMAFIPAGEFEMGNEGGDGDEDPVHTVYLDAYWIDKYEVTNAQYDLCVQSGECELPGCSDRDNLPVVCVDWYDAQAYCTWAGARLPSEAEWEKAARGDLEGQLYPWGDEDPNCILGAENGAQFRGSDCGDQLVEVGSYAPNGFGLFDMAGNVWEWVADWYDSNYYILSPTENPPGPEDGGARVLRGGSWLNHEGRLRVSERYSSYPDNPVNYYFGFRCASSP